MSEKKRGKRAKDEPETEHKSPAAYVVHHPEASGEIRLYPSEYDALQRARLRMWREKTVEGIAPAVKVSL